MSRATPPSEHLDYLSEIGVDILSSGTASTHAGSIPAASRVVATGAPVRPARVARPAAVAPMDLIFDSPAARIPARARRVLRHLPAWWPMLEWAVRLAFLLALLLLLAPLVLSRRGLAEEQPASGTQTPAAKSTPSPKEDDTVKRPTTKLQEAKAAPAVKHENTASDDAAKRHTDARPKGPDTRDSPRDVGAASTETALAGGASPVTPTALVAPRAGPAGGRGRAETPGEAPTAARPSTTSSLHGTALLGVETVLGIAFLAVLGTLVWDRRRLAERLSRVEGLLEPSSPKRLPSPGPVSVESTPPTPSDAVSLFTAASPEAALRALVTEAKRRRFGALPGAAIRPWGAGVASITGNVRRENQDAAIAFEVGSTAVLIVADGLGGLPHGQVAARLAVGAAALSIAEDLGRETSSPLLPELLAEKGLLDAASAVCSKARASGWATNLDGFRTTLIVVVATPSAYGYAYLGDGGGIVLRQAGGPEAFLVPQKADGVANIVSGSLGPVIQGSPAVGQLARRGGDALLIGTDGVFDRVSSDFAQSVAQLLVRHNGDAQAVASLVVSDFASAKEGKHYVCDDNMSLVILCTPVPRPAKADLTLRRPHAARG